MIKKASFFLEDTLILNIPHNGDIQASQASFTVKETFPSLKETILCLI